MSSTLWHRFYQTAQARGAAVAMMHGTRAVSFSDLAGMACAWADVLRDIEPGARVVIAAQNSLDLAAAVAGIWACGAVPVFVNADAPDSHLGHSVTQTGARAVLLDADRMGRALPLGCSATVHALVPLDPIAVLSRPVPVQDGAAPGSIVFTSGSTGMPKGVVQTALTLARGADRVAQAIGFDADDILLCPIPFAFDYGWGQLLSVLLRGMPMVLPQPRGAVGICDAIAAHRPTILAGVPAVFADLLSGLAPIHQIDRSSIRLITNTGSRIPEPVHRALCAAFPDAALSLNYGLTETYRSASLPVAMADQHPTSVGYALPGSTLSVLRADGTEAGVDEEGEIIHRGEGVFAGYWGDPVRTAEVRRPDPLWVGDSPSTGPIPMAVFTGDLGHKDAEGRLYIHGRRDRQMKSMGVRVSPDEVEGLLMASGLLAEVAVLPRPHDVLGDLIVAVIVLPDGGADGGPDGGPDASDALKAIKRHARATMSPFMQPRDHLVLAALPRNPNGKVDYPALKRLVVAQGATP